MEKLHKFTITITPLSIAKTQSGADTQKAIVIKIQNEIAKCSCLNQPMNLSVTVTFCTQTNKYLPVKGIIKIYDVLEDSKEVISCVGAFQINEFQEMEEKQTMISKLIGTTKIDMQILATRITQQKQQTIPNDQNQHDLSLLSSQNLIFNSEGSPNEKQNVFIQERTKIRRTNTIQTGQIIDLKSAVRFGAATSKISMPTGSKLTIKASNLFNQNNCKLFPGKLAQRQSFQVLHRVQMDEDDDYGNMELSIHSNSSKDKQIKPDQSSLGMPALDKQSNSNYSLEESHYNEKTEKPQNLDHSSFMYKSGKLEMVDSLKGNKIISSVNIGAEVWSVDEGMGEIVKGIYNITNLPQIQRIDSSQNLHPVTRLPADGIDLSTSNASITASLLQQYQKLEVQTLGEQLVEERRKNLELQQRFAKVCVRAGQMRDKYLSLEEQWENWCMLSYYFLNNVFMDENGQYIVEVNERKENIIIKYDLTKQGEAAFINFMVCTIQNSRHSKRHQTSMEIKLKLPEISQLKTRSHSEVSDIVSYDALSMKIKQQFEYQMSALTDKVNRMQEQIHDKQKMYVQVQDHNTQLKNQIQHLHQQLKTINSQLKQNHNQMETKLNQKEMHIQSLKRVLQDNNNQMDQLDEEMKELRKYSQNKELMLEEMRQQLADRDELIEMYRQTYGEINRYPSKNQEINIQKCIQNIIDANNRLDASQMSKGFQFPNGEISPIQKMSFSSDNQLAILRKRSASASSEIFSVQESIALENSLGGRHSLSRNSLSNPALSHNERELRSDRGLLLSLIRNQQRIYKMKLEEAKVAHKQMAVISTKIEDYIQKLQNQGNLFQSVK